MAWREAFAAFDDGSAEDRRLFDAGLWFAFRLAAARAIWDTLPRLPLEPARLVRLFAAMLNAHGGVQTTTPLRGMLEIEIANTDGSEPGQKALFPDYAFAGRYAQFVSTARITIANAATGQETGGPVLDSNDFPAVVNALSHRNTLASHYDALESLWAECVWNGWYVRFEEAAELVGPSDPWKAACRTVGSARRDDLGQQFMGLAMRTWRTLSDAERATASAAIVVVGIEESEGATRLRLGMRDASRENIPAEWLLQAGPHEMFNRRLLDVPMNKLAGVTLRKLLRVFWGLEPLAKLFIAQLPVPDDVNDFQTLEQFAPLIQRAELERVVMKLGDTTVKQARAVCRLFSLADSPRDDPWTKPLIQIGADEFTINVGVLSAPNLLWCAERWMMAGGVEPSPRGLEFEAALREQLAAVHSPAGAIVRPTALRLRGMTTSGKLKTEEIDLVVRIGHVVLIGELKCTFQATEPYDFHQYHEILREAGHQVLRKCDFARANVPSLLAQTGWGDIDETQLILHAAVVTNLPVGVGPVLADTPEVAVTDLLLLRRYIAGSPVEQLVVAGPQGLVHVARRKELYETPEEAAANFAEYLQLPPQLTPFFEHLDVRIEPILQLSGEPPAGFVHSRVVHPGADVTVAAQNES